MRSNINSDEDLLSSIKELDNEQPAAQKINPRDENLLSSIKELDGNQVSQMRANVYASTPIPPDTAAKQYDTFKQTNIPVGIVRSKENEIKQMTELDSINYDDLVNNFPKTALQLADVNKAGAIRDDISNLSYFEQIAKSVQTEYATSKENVPSADLHIKQMIYDVTGNEKFKLTPLEENTLAVIQQNQSTRPQLSDYNKLGFLSKIPAYTAAAIPTVLNTIPQTLVGTALGAGAGFAVAGPIGAAYGAKKGSQVGTAYGAGKLETGLAYQELRNLVDEKGKPIEKQVAAGGAIATGVVNGLLELAPFEEATGQIKKAFSREGIKQLAKTAIGKEYLKNIGKLAVAEGVTEGLQELINIVFGESAKAISTGDFKLLGMKDANDVEGFTKFISDSASRIAESAKAGFGGGIGLGSASGGIVAVQQVYDQRKDNKKDQGIISNIVTKTKESRTFKRSAELFKDSTENTLGEQNVYLPAEDVQTFFQTKSPEELEEFYKIAPEARGQIETAIETGGNVVLKGNSAAVAFASENFSGLQNFAKLSPETLNEKEAQDTFLNDVVSTVNRDSEVRQQSTENDKVKNNIKNQILGLRLPKDESQNLITTLTSYYDTKSARYGSAEAQKILDTYLGNLEVKNGVKNIKSIDDLDAFINKARSNKPIKKTKPLLKFLKEKGGVRLDSNLAGELKNIGLNPKTAPGLFRKEGGIGDVDNIPLSEFQERFPNVETNVGEDYVDRQAVLDLIGREVGGEDISQVKTDDQEKIGRFIEDLDRIGIELKTATNEDVKKAIDGFKDDENTFFQSPQDQTKTEAFKKWFGDSKVVDKKGKPLVVYHGTSVEINKFKTHEGAGGELTAGSYFTNNAKAANIYAESSQEIRGGNPNILPVYLSLQNPFDATNEEFIPTRKQLIREGFDGVIDKSKGDEYIQFVSFKPSQIKSAIGNKGSFDSSNPNIVFQNQKSPQGATQFLGQKPIISLFKNKNRSTLLHELGHVFLQIESDVAKLENVSEQTKKDWKTLEEWLDIKDGKITTESHEKFARGFEAYLREGRAPSIGLRNAFRRFKSWLEAIYKNVKSLNVELSKPVREVFDRMLATDEAIDELKNNPIFRADEKVLALLDEEEKAKYLSLVQNADEKTKEKLLAKALKELSREKTKSYKEEKQKVRAKIEEELKKTPIYRAFETLRSEDGFKINAADIENYEGDFISKLPKDIIAEDGVAVDMVADFLGFTDGGVMLNELANAPNFKSEVNRLTNEAMAERYREEVAEEKVIDESQNDARAKKILYELNATNAKVKTFIDTKEAYEQKAKDIISSQQIKEATNSYVFYLAEVKAAREAGVALGAKDFEKAVEWKKKQLLNHYLYRESLKVKDEVEDLRKRSIRYNKKPVAGKVWIEEDYRERIVSLLEDFNLVENTIGHEKTNISQLETWKKEQTQEGVLGLVDFPEIVEFQNEDNIRNLTTNQFRTLDDAISNLAHVGQGLRTLEIDGKRVEIEQIAEELVELVNKNIKKDKPSLEDPTTREKLIRDFDSYTSSLIKTSQTTLKIDGEENLGKFYNYFEKNVNNSELKKEEMKNEAYEKFDEIYKKHFGGYKITNKRTNFEQVGKSYSKPAVLTFALNWGNEINRRRVRDGFGYNNEQVTSILSSLTKNELEFVQDVWDMVNAYWPQVEATQKRLFGFAPKKQRAIPFVLKSSDGQAVKMKGGYYPIAYSKEASLVSDTKEDLKEFFAGSAADKISFHASYTKERSEEKISKKIDLTLSPLTRHISQVITDIAMKESVWNAYKIINNRRLSAALIKKIGLADYKQLQTWLYDMYGRTLVQEGGLGKLASLSRSIATTYAMGFKAATALIQVTGIFNSTVKLGYKNMGNGIWKALGNGNPVSVNKAAKLAFAKSKILEDRSKTINRDIYEVMDRLQRSGKITKAIAKFAFFATTKAQMLVDLPTWYGGYYKGLKDFNGDDAKAVELADRLLIETQGSSYRQSRSAIERNEAGIVKAFTAFYSYMNVKLNLLTGSYRKNNFKKPKDVVSFASDFFLLFFTDALVTEFLREGVSNLLAGRDSEDDEDENKALHYANLIGQSLASSIPGVSQFYSGLSGYSYNPAGFKGFEIFGKGVKNLGTEIIKGLDGDEEADLLKTLRALNDTLSIFTVGGGGQIDIFLRAEQEAEKGEDVALIDYILKPPK